MQAWRGVTYVSHSWGEHAVVGETDEIGVAEQVREFELHVPVVDVDRHRAQLEAAEHHLKVLSTIAQHHADVVAGSDPGAGEMMRDAVRPCVKICVGESGLRRDHGVSPTNRVRHPLEQLGEVETHEVASLHSAASALGIVSVALPRRFKCSSIKGLRACRPDQRDSSRLTLHDGCSIRSGPGPNASSSRLHIVHTLDTPGGAADGQVLEAR